MNRIFRQGIRSSALLAALALVAAACVASGASPTGSPTTGPTASASGSPIAPASVDPGTTGAPPSTAASPAVDVPAPQDSPGHTAAAGGSQISESDNGRSVTAHVGSDVTLVLHTTYWQIARIPDTAVLTLASGPTYSGAGLISCIPGTGCGTVTAVYHAVAPGKATLTASRTSCGEALACTGSASSYQVTIVVQA